MTKILCGTDLLPKSDSALERAGMLAERLAAQCVLVHAVPRAEPHVAREEELRQAASRLRQRVISSPWHHRVDLAFEVRRGGPVPVLVDTARELEPQLIVLGSNRRRFASDALAGTIAERVAKQVDCPVLVVRRMPWRAYSRVLLVLDGRDSNEIVAAAGRLVLDGEAGAGVARPHASFCASLIPAAEHSLADAIERPQALDRPLGSAMELGAAETSQLALVDERAVTSESMRHEIGRLNPDLLVVGVGRRGWVRRMVLGDAARRLLAMRSSDALLVPRRRQCIAPRRRAHDGGSGRWSRLTWTREPRRRQRAEVYCRHA